MAAYNAHLTTCTTWYNVVTSYYPDSSTSTYSVPPVHFNRVPYVRAHVPGTRLTALVLPGPAPTGGAAPVRNVTAASQPLLPSEPRSLWSPEPQPAASPTRVQESDFQDDAAQAHTMRNLQALGDSRSEPMFILSQLRFGDYVSKPAYAAAAAHLPRPSQLDTTTTRFSHGECDILMIHRHYGLLIGELKSVGANHDQLKFTQVKSDAALKKRVVRAVSQLNRSKKVLSHIVGDIAPGLAVRTTLFLPHVSAAQLQRVLDGNPSLGQDVCSCVGASNTAQAVQLCCCKDQLSDPMTREIADADISRLGTWWGGRMDRKDPQLSDDLYLEIVARFVGPASSVNIYCSTPPRVEVRTEGEAIAELGRRMARLVLTPVQVDLLDRSPRLVYLTGPPGTGKTVTLVMEGLSWLCQGKDTFVVSTHPGTFAVNSLTVEQLRRTATANPTSSTQIGRVLHRFYDFLYDSTALGRAVRELTAAARGGNLFVILDEADFHTSGAHGQDTVSFVGQLIAGVPGLHLWCAGIRRDTTPPRGLQVEVLTTPLRSAPRVLEEVRPSLDRHAVQVHSYAISNIPAPGDGKRARRVRHEGSTHAGRRPVECEQCGRDVATELRRLGAGVPGSGITCRDVFVITRSTDLQDEVNDGLVKTPASGVVRGIRGEGFTVSVLGWVDFRTDRVRWARIATDVATAATDSVTVADLGTVSGLERKVVVWIPGRIQGVDDHLSDADIEDEDRLTLVTRCTTQLVVVDVPPVILQSSDSHDADNDDSTKKDGAVGGKKKDNSDDTGVSWAWKCFLL